MFRSLKDNWKKAEAAAVLEKLLEEQVALGLFGSDPAKSANILVGKAWDAHPELFDGRFGQRPHKLATAAATLAMTLERLPETSSSRDALTVCLGRLLAAIAEHGVFLPLTALDHRLLDHAGEVFAAIADA